MEVRPGQAAYEQCPPVPVIRDPSYSEGRSKCPPTVSHTSDIDASKYTLHIVSDTPGGTQ